MRLRRHLLAGFVALMPALAMADDLAQLIHTNHRDEALVAIRAGADINAN